MERVRLQEISDDGVSKRVLATIPEARRPDEVPNWAKALANSERALDRYLSEREEIWDYFGPEEHYTMQFVLASVSPNPCMDFAISRLREIGYGDDRLVDLATMSATVYRNMLITDALGIEVQYGHTSAFVKLLELEGKVASSFETVPNWAKALAHNPKALKRIIDEHQVDLGFDSENWTMAQFALSVERPSSRCGGAAIKQLQERYGWNDEKVVEFSIMNASHISHGVLFDSLGIKGF